MCVLLSDSRYLFAESCVLFNSKYESLFTLSFPNSPQAMIFLNNNKNSFGFDILNGYWVSSISLMPLISSEKVASSKFTLNTNPNFALFLIFKSSV